MFGKLKEKLKEKLSLFSRKTKEEAEEQPVIKAAEEKLITPRAEEKPIIKREEEKQVRKREEKIEKKTISAEELIAESLEEEQDEFKPVGGIVKKEKLTPILKEKFTPLIVKEKPPLEVKKHEERKSVDESRQKPVVEEKKKEEREEKEELLEKSKEDEERKRKEELLEKDEKEETGEQPAEKQSFFGKIKQALTTKTISGEKFEELFWDLEITLLENNVSVEVIEKIKEDLQRELVDKPLPRDVEGKILETLKETLSVILDFEPIDLLTKIKEKNNDKKTYVIAFFGINGAGKTTSIAKVTRYFQKQGLSVVLAACDTFRAAAIQQLQEHADILKVKMIKQDYGSDAAAVAFDAVKYAEKNNINVVLIDTAGRLHSNTNLMAELEKLIRVSKPDLKIFVGESITGNDCIEQARQFNALVEQDGIILTKADIDEKGGAPLSISYVIKKPILFLGMGQKYEDLEVFNKEKILERLGL